MYYYYHKWRHFNKIVHQGIITALSPGKFVADSTLEFIVFPNALSLNQFLRTKGLEPCDGEPAAPQEYLRDNDTIYHIQANNDRPYTLGYVKNSRQEDIEAFFEEQKAYGLIIEPITVQVIPRGLATKKKEIQEKIKVLRAELSVLESKLKGQ